MRRSRARARRQERRGASPARASLALLRRHRPRLFIANLPGDVILHSTRGGGRGGAGSPHPALGLRASRDGSPGARAEVPGDGRGRGCPPVLGVGVRVETLDGRTCRALRRRGRRVSLASEKRAWPAVPRPACLPIGPPPWESRLIPRAEESARRQCLRPGPVALFGGTCSVSAAGVGAIRRPSLGARGWLGSEERSAPQSQDASPRAFAARLWTGIAWGAPCVGVFWVRVYKGGKTGVHGSFPRAISGVPRRGVC